MVVRELQLVRERPVDGPGWVYTWIWPDGIRYIGATWLDPAVRADVHLHGGTDDPRSLALRAAVATDGPPDRILALGVPAPLDRAQCKQALIAACQRNALLSASFIDPGTSAPATPAPATPADGQDGWIEDALRAIRPR